MKVLFPATTTAKKVLSKKAKRQLFVNTFSATKYKVPFQFNQTDNKLFGKYGRKERF